MAESPIEWVRRPRADGSLMPGYTFNPWWGCVEVSPACDDCYARAMASRFGWNVWGVDEPRRFFGAAHWQAPLAWDRGARELGEQHLVFCASMADVFERRADLRRERARLWELIRGTPSLVWLLLSKRKPLPPPGGAWPSNVWLGVTVESAAELWRVKAALRFDAARHFVSHEPSVGDVDLSPYLGAERGRVQWVILGTESGAGRRSRVLPLDRARRMVDQARAAGAAAFVKQLDAGLLSLGPRGRAVKTLDLLPLGLRVREWPTPLPVAA